MCSNPDSQAVAEVTLKRQQLEVSMHAGVVSETLNDNVTHMIVYTSSEQVLPFRTRFKRYGQFDSFLVNDCKGGIKMNIVNSSVDP